MSRLVLSLALSGAVGHRRAGAELSDARGHGDRAVRRRRPGRHHRPHRRRYLLAPPRPAVRGRERRRRRRHHRHDRAPRAPAPDGYTLVSGHIGTHAAAPALYPNLGYDPEKDFEPIGLIAEQPELLTVRKDFPANNLKEFVAYAKANESKLNMGHAGVGSVSYIGCLLLNSRDRHQADAGAVHRHRAGDERDPRRHRSTTTAIRCSGRCRMCAPAPPRRWPSPPRSAARCCRTCRPRPSRACRSSIARRSTRCSRPRARRRTIVDKLAEALNKGLDEPAVRKRLETSAPTSPSRTGAARRRWRRWCRARSRG